MQAILVSYRVTTMLGDSCIDEKCYRNSCRRKCKWRNISIQKNSPDDWSENTCYIVDIDEIPIDESNIFIFS